jgi:molybdopterin molybdotransferase
MAQLSDDCFAFSGPLMRIEQAESLIAERVAPVVEVEPISLAAARGRVLAADLIAAMDLPPFRNSAVDGYAVQHADLASAGETRLRVAARTTAGQASASSQAGQAVRIFTGAPMPAGADTVFMQEDCRLEADQVILPAGLKPGANSRLAGEDVQAGTLALPAGTRLRAPQLAMAAALGLTALKVRRRVRVALISTGDELVTPGKPLPPAHIYDANRTLLTHLVEAHGAEVTDFGIVPDAPDALHSALRDAAKHDLILTSGGVSTGEADHVRSAVESIGKLVFWRIAIKPGRPVAMGVIPGQAGNAAFMGLPGNPVAAFVTFARVVRPLLLRLAGALPEPLTAYPVRSGFAYRKKAGRREYVRVRLQPDAAGALTAQKHPREGAGVLSSLTETHGLAELADEVIAVAPGDWVGFIPYSAMLG